MLLSRGARKDYTRLTPPPAALQPPGLRPPPVACSPSTRETHVPLRLAMSPLLPPPQLQRFDPLIASWMQRHGARVLHIALGVIFVWFGALKVVAASPADQLVRATVYWVDPDWFIPVLGLWEIAIGVCLAFRPLLRLGILLLFLQLPGTFLPMVLLPEVVWARFPFVLTMEGQYIVKNLVIIGAALVLGGTLRRPSPQLTPTS